MISSDEYRQKAEANLQSAKDPLTQLRYKLLKKGVAGIKEFARVFRRNDDDHNKKLSLQELSELCDEYGVDMDMGELKDLFEQLDTDKTGSVTFDEFMVALRPPMNLKRMALINKAFDKLDSNGNGVVTMKDLDGVYNYLKNPHFLAGEKTKEQIFGEFLTAFELSGHVDGRVTKEEFFNYCAGVSAAVDTDEQFEKLMKNAWTLE